ncbi:MAG: hypothetical protein ABGW50_02090 [Thermococcus sp.]
MTSVEFSRAFKEFVEWLKEFRVKPALRRRILYLLMRELSAIENYAKWRAAYLAYRGVYVEPSVAFRIEGDSVVMVVRMRVAGVDDALAEDFIRKSSLPSPASFVDPKDLELIEENRLGYMGNYTIDSPFPSPVKKGDEDTSVTPEVVKRVASPGRPSGQAVHKGSQAHSGPDGRGVQEAGNNAGGVHPHGNNERAGGVNSMIKDAIERALKPKAYWDDKVGDYVIEDIDRPKYDDEFNAYLAYVRQVLGPATPLPTKLPRTKVEDSAEGGESKSVEKASGQVASGEHNDESS